jgi:two-component system, sensor histidine kinase and response regulator
MYKEPLIFIVDDNENNLQVLGNHLLEHDFDVSLANNGYEALEVLKEGDLPDLILMDIMMPGIDGIEVCKRIKSDERTQHIPVIFLTAKSDAADIVFGLESGGVDYVTKPFNSMELLARINNQLEVKFSRDEIKAKNKELALVNDALLKSRKMLKSKNRELNELNNAKDKFFSIIAHDLKNPLQALLLTSDLMNRYIDDVDIDKIREKTSNIKDATKQIIDLLNNLLQWSRSQTGRIKFEPEIIDFFTISDNILSLFRNQSAAKNIQIKSRIAPSTLVKADYNMLYTVARNVVSNAVKFTPNGGTVNITSHTENHSLIIKIEDSGIGIDEKNIKKLFRVDSTYTRVGTNKEHGTGLGLILCKDFIEKHNGSISVTSKVGEGTVFLISIPTYYKSKDIAISDEEESENVAELPKFTDEEIDNLQDSFGMISELYHDQLEKLSKYKMVDEMKLFADNLVEIGKNNYLPQLHEIGKKISSAVDSFDIVEIDEGFSQFSQYFNNINKIIKNSKTEF